MADRLAQMHADGLFQVLYVAFNNHFRGRAMANAGVFTALLSQRSVPVEGPHGEAPPLTG